MRKFCRHQKCHRNQPCLYSVETTDFDEGFGGTREDTDHIIYGAYSSVAAAISHANHAMAKCCSFNAFWEDEPEDADVVTDNYDNLLENGLGSNSSQEIYRIAYGSDGSCSAIVSAQVTRFEISDTMGSGPCNLPEEEGE